MEEKKDAIDKLISETLAPQLATFHKELEKQLRLIRLSDELEYVRKDELQYKTELFDRENGEVKKLSTHDIFADFGFDIINGFEEKLKDILKQYKVGGASTALLNKDTFDVEIGGLKKSVSNGGGYCGILNTLTTLAMGGYLIDLDRPAPGFYAVDSSLTPALGGRTQRTERNDQAKLH